MLGLHQGPALLRGAGWGAKTALITQGATKIPKFTRTLPAISL